MGYSISVTCKSVKEKERMLRFLKDNYKPFHKISSDVDPAFDPSNFIQDGPNLAYDSGVLKIGYNYSTSGNAAGYMFGVLRFIALREGRKRPFKGLRGMHPYTIYDGHEVEPVLVTEEGVPDSFKQYVCDANGFRPEKAFGPVSQLLFRKEIERRNKAVAYELARLGECWRKFWA